MLPKFQNTKPMANSLLPPPPHPPSDFKVAVAHDEVIICLIPWIWVLSSIKIIKITQFSGKTNIVWLWCEVKKQYSFNFPGTFNPWNWWKECSWTLKRLKNFLNWQGNSQIWRKRSWQGKVGNLVGIPWNWQHCAKGPWDSNDVTGNLNSCRLQEILA